MHERILVVALAGLLGLPGAAAAHEGHEHKEMGRVAAIDDTHIEVVAQDGTAVSAQLGPATKYLRGRQKVARSDVRVGERVVLTVVEDDEALVAKEVALASGDVEPRAESDR